MSNENLIRAKHEKNDEFYTRLVDLKGLESKKLAGKKIFLPCDSKDSAFTLKMKELNLNFKNSTIDIFSKESLKLSKEADIVITNPPFSKLRKIIEVYEENSINFTLLAPLTFLSTKFFFDRYMKGQIECKESGISKFENESGLKIVQTVWITNCGFIPSIKKYFVDQFDDKTRIPVVDELREGYRYEKVFVPITVFIHPLAGYKFCDYHATVSVKGKKKFKRILIEKGE